ncbi:PRC-barrel domain protein [Paraburkholderia sp. BL27I4N3]|nr:PRC-barrel domain protein [Paraburkholderia sp. BL27I4N3]RKR38876.1 PRC-barrel domain protein [Paraburkholderia sp. BL17N1]
MNLCRARSGISVIIADPVSHRRHDNEGNLMKTNLLVWLLASSLALPLVANAQVAGTQPLGVSVEESAAIVAGWSVRKSVMDKPVFNEKGERVGVIHDIIVAPDRSVSFAIVAANQFLGVSHHDVAIPIEQLDFNNGKLLLAGATKDAIKALPEFQYAKVRATPKARADYKSEHH